MAKMSFTRAVKENLSPAGESTTDLAKQMKNLSEAEKVSLWQDMQKCGIDCDPPAPKVAQAS